MKSWQVRNGVVSSGTPATTGFGAVGPRTRAKIANVCRGIISSPFTATPTSGAAPLQVQFTSPSSCVQPYSIDFGDGQTSGQIVVPPCNADGSRPLQPKSTYHTYAAAGTYTASLTGEDRSSCSPPNAQGFVQCTSAYRTTLTVTITVSGNGNTGVNFSVHPTSSKPPFYAIFRANLPLSESPDAYFVDFGDGTNAKMIRNHASCIPEDYSCTGGPVASVYVSHEYTVIGVYAAKLIKDFSGCMRNPGGPCLPVLNQMLGTLTITVDPSIPIPDTRVY